MPHRRSLTRRRLAPLALLVALFPLVAIAEGAAIADVSPPSATLTIAAGSSASETKTVTVPSKPSMADIEIAIDTTGSMASSIAQAKADATNLVTAVQASVPDSQFAIVQFKDDGDIPEYEVVQAMTANATDVQTAVNGLFASGGGDAPEAYNLVFRNSYTPDTGGDIGWRAGSRKFVVVMGDAQPHGAGSAGLTGCTDASIDPHGLNTATELAGMASARRTLFMIRQASTASATLQCYQSIAAAAFAGGQGEDAGGSLATEVVNLINAATSTVSDVHLEVVSASPAPAAASWISFTPATAGPVTPPATLTFTLTASVPSGTPSGSYAFDVEAVADGADIGHQALTIVVGTTPAGDPRTTKQGAVTTLQAMLPTGDELADRKISRAIHEISRSLMARFWVDGSHLVTETGKKVFHAEKEAVVALGRIPTPPSGVADVVAALVEADRALARTAIDDATAAGGDATMLAKAAHAMDVAADELAAGRPGEAIEDYRRAWYLAVTSTP